MRRFIVVPEGLAIDAKGVHHVSDHYQAALDLVMQLARREDIIYLAPANAFGANREEDTFALEYLQAKKCEAQLEVISRDTPRTGYLDTLDNALYLKHDLAAKGKWPPGPVELVCNRPHRLRSVLLFRSCGYHITAPHTSKSLIRSGNRMVGRLWFYDVPWVQYFYELAATAYGCCRALFLKEQH